MTLQCLTVALLLLLLVAAFPAAAQTRAAASPAADAILAAIESGDVPGAVLIAGRRDGVTRTLALGERGKGLGPLAPDAIFDLASLTKPIATATSVLILVDDGKLALADPASKYLPEFTGNGKDAITIEQLLRHTSGLIADNPLADYQTGPDNAWAAICALTPRSPPGTRFEYSDVGFIVLAKLVERVAGTPLPAFAADRIFTPLKMIRTHFGPLDPAMAAAAVPTEKRDGSWIQGQVHDPRAHLLGGWAGHAGLFSTAHDVARWCAMLLRGGELDGASILKPQTAALMTAGLSVPAIPLTRRGLGVDVDTSFSPAPRGNRFPVGSTFGHTGFTGTSFWADPASGSFYVLLTSRLHPAGKGDVRSLRSAVATAVAVELLPPAPDPSPVLNGIDVLQRDNFKILAGKRIGIITNHSGRNLAATRTVDLLAAAPGVEIVCLFSPEHGLFGVLDEKIGHGTDDKTGLKVYSLYGETRKPTRDMLAGIDTLVFDIQDAGARFYTYSATLGLAMEAAADAGIDFVVLDRPNPITGTRVDGPIAEPEFFGFTAYGPLPVAHGMTLGELAKLYTSDWNPNPRLPEGRLTVVPVQGWKRDMWFDQTNLTWVNPSPNLRNLTQAALYPGICLLEAANVSVGRGTDEPFSTLGAPWIDGRQLAAALNADNLPGVRFIPTEFTPTSSKFKDQPCRGVSIVVTDRLALQPVRTGLAIAWHLRAIHGAAFEFDKVVRLLQNRSVLEAVRSAQTPAEFQALWSADVEAFRSRREPFLLYK